LLHLLSEGLSVFPYLADVFLLLKDLLGILGLGTLRAMKDISLLNGFFQSDFNFLHHFELI
jgi:hypothetical protein